jgi:hypothetical protein
MLAVLLLTCRAATTECALVSRFDTVEQCEKALVAAAAGRPELTAHFPMHCETRPSATAPGLRT